MYQIKIPQNIKLENLEAYYQELNDKINKNIVVDLLLPKKILYGYLGIVPSLYQFVFTWVRYENSGKLLLDIEKPGETDFEEIYKNELLFPLVSLVWNKNGIYNNQGKINLRNFLKPQNSIIFDKMQSLEPLKNKNLLLTNFDHLPNERGILKFFETNQEFIKNESKLSESLDFSISKLLLDYSRDSSKMFLKEKKSLVSIIFELMKNTYEWARDNENRIPLDPNVRGVHVKLVKKRRNSLIDDFRYHPGLCEYFSSEVLKENSQNELLFLEISVFDSGIGFVRKNIFQYPELSEIEIIKKCMIKHSTSSLDLGKDDKGLGLDRILTILDRSKGLFRLKTGSVCVYRNMITHKYKIIETGNLKKMELFDWVNNSNTKYSSFIPAEGTVITILYPLSLIESNEINNEQLSYL